MGTSRRYGFFEIAVGAHHAISTVLRHTLGQPCEARKGCGDRLTVSPIAHILPTGSFSSPRMRDVQEVFGPGDDCRRFGALPERMPVNGAVYSPDVRGSDSEFCASSAATLFRSSSNSIRSLSRNGAPCFGSRAEEDDRSYIDKAGCST